jgi:excinuclease ABC subunit C
MTASALDSVRGLGESRRAALVKHFGSVAKLKQATVAEITAVPGIGVATARAVLEALGVAPDSAGTGTANRAMGDDRTRASG